MASRPLSRKDVRLFLVEAASGSVSQAARKLHLGRATVSHCLAEPRVPRHAQGAEVTTSSQRLPSATSRRA